MVTSLDYSIRVPNVGDSLANTSNMQPNVGVASTGLPPLFNSASTSSSSLNLRDKVTDFSDNSFCATITRIWNDFIEAISSCFSKVYHWVIGTPSYPKINQNFSREALQQIYWGLGRDNKWRESIDGVHQYLNDKYCYDRGTHGGTVENGFIGSIEASYPFVEQFLNSRVDADWYLLLHRHTCAHFQGLVNNTLMAQDRVGVFRDSDDVIGASLPGPHYLVTPEAFVEFAALDQEIKNEFGPTYGLGVMSYTNASQTQSRIDYKSMSRTQIRQVFNKFLHGFYREIDAATTADQKLWAIAKLQQRLEWLHPVRDGTARTSTMLMNKFLTDYGFHPAILQYPHKSTTLGLAAWKQYLQDGLVKWEQEKARLNPVTTTV